MYNGTIFLHLNIINKVDCMLSMKVRGYCIEEGKYEILYN